MPIVDPGPIWKVDSARDHAKTEFSHSLDCELSVRTKRWMTVVNGIGPQSWTLATYPGLTGGLL